MTPMKAWHTISANLNQLYKMMRTPTFKGFTEADTEAEVICFHALKELEERKNQKPLTIAELEKMHGLPVWIADENVWGIVHVDEYGKWAGKPFVSFYWKSVHCDYDIQKRKLKCYRYKPEEEK